MRQQYSLILASTLKTITHNRVEPPPTKCPRTDGLGTARSPLSLRNTATPTHIGTYGLPVLPHNMTLLCALFCQGVFGLGGQDWVERHRVGGRLL